MIKIIERVNKKDDGTMAPWVVVIALVFLLFFCIGWEYLRMITIVLQVDRAVEMSVDGVAKDNWENVYQGVREGYAGAYTKDSATDAWSEVVNKQSVLGQLKETIDFEVVGDTWVKADENGAVLFSLKPKETEVKIINTNLGASEGNALVIETTNTITVPWMFAGLWLDAEPLVIERTNQCGYTPKF